MPDYNKCNTITSDITIESGKTIDGVDISTHDHTGVNGHGIVVTAGSIVNVPAGNIAATNAQTAINELDTEKVAKTGDTMTGALVITAANIDDIIPLTINQLDTTGAKNALNIVNSGIGKGMYIDQNANGRALEITSDSTTQPVLLIDAGSLTTASALRIRSDSADISSRNVAIIINDNVLAVGAVALTVQQDSTGNGIFLDQNGDGIALHIDNDGTANAITVEGTTATDLILTKAGLLGIGQTPSGVSRLEIVLTGVPAAANNAEAAAAGVAIGGFYRTNADPSILCIRAA